MLIGYDSSKCNSNEQQNSFPCLCVTKGKLQGVIIPAIFHKVQLHIFKFPNPCSSQAPLSLTCTAHLSLSLLLCLFHHPIAQIRVLYACTECACSKSLYETREKRDLIKSKAEQSRQNRGKHRYIS